MLSEETQLAVISALGLDAETEDLDGAVMAALDEIMTEDEAQETEKELEALRKKVTEFELNYEGQQVPVEDTRKMVDPNIDELIARIAALEKVVVELIEGEEEPPDLEGEESEENVEGVEEIEEKAAMKAASIVSSLGINRIPSGAQTMSKISLENLWSTYRNLPVEERNEFYAKNIKPVLNK